MVTIVIFGPIPTITHTFQPVFLIKFDIVQSTYVLSILVELIPVQFINNVKIFGDIPYTQLFLLSSWHAIIPIGSYYVLIKARPLPSPSPVVESQYRLTVEWLVRKRIRASTTRPLM
jgi:hypothetical protein